ncbi:sigma-70 family RNA polymerase sigma factor [Pseudoflavonifractor phocaeensis]|nr:sigma-70 family RNA polymerase sigma factor [Pseudoflavonifractor phocaeensis]
MSLYSKAMAGDNSEQVNRLRRNVTLALREDVTPRQRECMLLYYGKGLNMREIGEIMGINKSTVSRIIKRGERRLRRCLRYGADQLLAPRDPG